MTIQTYPRTAQLEVIFKDLPHPLLVNITYELQDMASSSKTKLQTMNIRLQPVSLLRFATYESLLPENVDEIRVVPRPQHGTPSKKVTISSASICSFILHTLQHCNHGGQRLFTLFIPLSDERAIVDSEGLDTRLSAGPLIEKVIWFDSPLHSIPPRTPSNREIPLPELLESSIYGFLLPKIATSFQTSH